MKRTGEIERERARESSAPDDVQRATRLAPGNQVLAQLAGRGVRVGGSRAPEERMAERAGQAIAGRHPAPCACGTCAHRATSGERGDLRRATVDREPPSQRPAATNQAATAVPLDSQLAAELGPAFGASFDTVRVHRGPAVDVAADQLGARAFAVGEDLYFGRDQFNPHSLAGRELLGHELAHVVQHRASGAPVLRRAELTIGKTSFKINYGDIIRIPAANFASAIDLLILTLTGGPDPALSAAVGALSTTRQQWVLHAIDVLDDNKTPQHTPAEYKVGISRLITRAATATSKPLGAGFREFAREALQVSGWLEISLTAGLSPPAKAVLDEVNKIYNPTAAVGGVVPPLDTVRFAKEATAALTAFLLADDPGAWKTPASTGMAPLLGIAGEVQALAQAFFSPFADTASDSALAAGFDYKTMISDATLTVPTAEQVESLLANRLQVVGWSPRSDLVTKINRQADGSTASRSLLAKHLTDAGIKTKTSGAGIIEEENKDTSIFEDCHVDTARDEKEIERVVTAVAGDPALNAAAVRIFQHTGSHDPATHQVRIVPKFNQAVANECRVRWARIKTLCHELVHALTSTRFRTRTESIGFSQVTKEGFTEVLGNQLFQHVRARAFADKALRARMETGIAGPCPVEIPDFNLGYGSAAQKAEEVRGKVGDERFRAAYFLGRAELVGL